MESLVDVLDRQLSNGTVTIPAACARLATQLQQATTDDIKALHSCLPKLLSTILHSAEPNKRSWLNRSLTQTDLDSVLTMLLPEGPLFSVLLPHSHKAVYDVSESQWPSRLESSQLAAVFRERLVNTSTGPVLRLDISEYFLYSLLNLCRLPKEPSPSNPGGWMSVFETRTVNRQVIINDLLTLSSPGSLPTQFDNQGASEVYLVLLDRYLKYLLPLSNTVPNAYTSKLAIHQSQVIKLSEFFLFLFMEYHVTVRQYGVDEGTGRPKTQTPLNLDRQLALQRLVEHLTCATFTPAQNYAVQGLIESILPGYRISLYQQLRSLLSAWPLDNTLAIFMELWMIAIYPWRIVDERYLTDVSSDRLVMQDYHIYHSILDDILGTFCSVFESWNQLDGDAVDGAALSEQVGPLVASLLDLLLNMERILPSLRKLESEAASSFSKTSCNRMILEQLQARESSGKYTPSVLFVGDSGKNRAAYLAGLLEQCKDRIADSTETVSTWIAELVNKLKETFEFKQPILYVSQHHHTEHPVSSLHHRSLPANPVNRITVTKNAQSGQSAALRRGEIRILVSIFGKLSSILDECFHGRANRVPVLHAYVKNIRINLRFLAIPGNLLLFVVLLIISVYIQLKCMRAVLRKLFH